MMIAWRPISKLLLGVFYAVIVSACTRSADMVQTPLMPPVQPPSADLQDRGSITPTIQVAIDVTNTPLPQAVLTPEITETELRYAVIFLADGEVLNVRSGPGVTNSVVGSLQPNARDLRPTGQQEDVDGVPWVEIVQPEGGEGWVSSDFLTEQTTPSQVCNDPQVGTLLDQFGTAVRNQDGPALARLASPNHGLTIQYTVWNPPVVLDEAQVLENLFTSTVDYDWGVQDGSGESLVGPFKDIILPRLENVLLQSHTRNCNTLERGIATGGTTGYVYWPYDFASLNYVALYRPAPAEQEQDWRTWVAGIEYFEGRPYLAVLIQFYWEI